MKLVGISLVPWWPYWATSYLTIADIGQAVQNTGRDGDMNMYKYTTLSGVREPYFQVKPATK